MILWRKIIHLPFWIFQVVIQIILRITTLNEFCIFVYIVWSLSKFRKIYPYYLVLTDASKQYKSFLFLHSESSESDSRPRSTRLRFSPDQPFWLDPSKAWTSIWLELTFKKWFPNPKLAPRWASFEVRWFCAKFSGNPFLQL